MNLMKPLAVIGKGGHGRSVMQVARHIGYVLAVFLDDHVEGADVAGKTEKIYDKEFQRRYDFVVGVGDNRFRQNFSSLAEIGGATLATLIHPNAAVDHRGIEEGTVVFAGAVVGADAKIGPCCIINHGAVVDHDCVIGDSANINGGAVLGGRVKVGQRAFIGLNATVLPGIEIGPDVVIGAGAVVIEDALEGTWVGNPARRVK